MQDSIVTVKAERIVYPELPLTIYREIASHLHQIEGVKVTFLPQTDLQFSYTQSQIGGLLIEYSDNFSTQSNLDEILDYYQQIHVKMSRETISPA